MHAVGVSLSRVCLHTACGRPVCRSMQTTLTLVLARRASVSSSCSLYAMSLLLHVG